MKLATLCYVRANHQTLMLHRVKKRDDMHAGKWNGLGGKLEPGETPEECVIREVFEESGLTITQPVLRGVLTFPAFAKEEDWYAFVFVAKTFSGSLIDSSEGVLAWIDDDRLAELNLWEGDHLFLPWLDQEIFFSGRFAYVNGVLVDHSVVFYTPGTVAARFPVRESETAPAAAAPSEPAFQPHYRSEDDTYCWVCGGAVTKRHCKIVCTACGFTRDCSDP